jgi:formamidopyrimidine-DNA glycosylase
MPELPEVEVIRRGLALHLPGRHILGLALGEKRLRQQASREQLENLAVGHCIRKLSRRGKYLLLHLDQGATLLIHLGMTGQLLFFPGSSPPLPHVHIIVYLEGGPELIFQDLRRFGQFLIYPPGVVPPALARVGLEPFSRRLTPDWLMSQTLSHKRPIKNFLLDSRFIAGIGNIYACETLFAAGLHPQTPVGDLSREEWVGVIKATRRILRAAIRLGGTTIATFRDSGGVIGSFHPRLKVYGHEGEPCPYCGAQIVRIVQAGRSSFFCPRCQVTR